MGAQGFPARHRVLFFLIVSLLVGQGFTYPLTHDIISQTFGVLVVVLSSLSVIILLYLGLWFVVEPVFGVGLRGFLWGMKFSFAILIVSSLLVIVFDRIGVPVELAGPVEGLGYIVLVVELILLGRKKGVRWLHTLGLFAVFLIAMGVGERVGLILTMFNIPVYISVWSILYFDVIKESGLHGGWMFTHIAMLILARLVVEKLG